MRPEQELHDKSKTRNPLWKKVAIAAGIVAVPALITSLDFDEHPPLKTNVHVDDGFGGFGKIKSLGIRPPFTFTEDSLLLFEFGPQSYTE